MPEPYISLLGSSDCIDATLVSDTSILAAGDVITDTLQIPAVVPDGVTCAQLQTLLVFDEDDQGQALDLVFFRSNVSLGTKNAAPNISDVNAREILGVVSVLAADFIDLGGMRVATLRNVGLLLEPDANRAIYVSAICRSATPTYTASGLKLKLGLKYRS